MASPRAALPLAILRQLAWAALTLLGALCFVFALMNLAPGDPIDLLPNAAEVRPTLEAAWHLDEPPPVRLAQWLGQVATGDLGTSVSYRPGAPVLKLIWGPGVASISRVLSALFCSLCAAIALAWWTSARPHPLPRALVVAWSTVPVFLLAYGLVSGLNAAAYQAIEAGTIQRPDWFALPDQASSLRTALAVLILATASGALAELHGEIDAVLRRLRESPFIDAARARGAPLFPHLAWNLLPPLATVAADRAAFLLGGTVVLEKVLLLPGAGALLWNAAELRDYEVVLGIALFTSATVVWARALADVVRVSVDPRLRVGP